MTWIYVMLSAGADSKWKAFKWKIGVQNMLLWSQYKENARSRVDYNVLCS